MIKKIIIIFFIISSICVTSYATDEIIKEQMSSLKISDFISESENYTKDTFPNLDINELLNSAISGQINNKGIYSSIFSLLGQELVKVLKILASILLIIVIHSLLKSVSDNLANNSVSKITYYVEYILIVTLVLISFSEVITITKNSIQNLRK